MCGRYYVDDDTAKEIERLVRKLDNRIKPIIKTDVYPTNPAPVLHRTSPENHDDQILALSDMNWGFPQYNRNGVLFNARSETVLEKSSFFDSARHRRCLIPARGFYEWDRDKNKNTFERKDHNLMLFAGIWNGFDAEKYFTIITTAANASMKSVHDRMPLILEKEDIATWLYDDSRTQELLQKEPIELLRTSGCIQQSLFE